MKMNPVVHFEMGAEDKKRMSDFYSTIFGWKVTEMGGPEYGGYMTVSTGETDEKTGFPKNPGMINGGFYPQNPSQKQPPSLVIAVDNVEESVKKIKEKGGTIVSGPDSIPGVGIYVSFKDTEGNRVSILQPSQM